MTGQLPSPGGISQPKGLKAGLALNVFDASKSSHRLRSAEPSARPVAEDSEASKTGPTPTLQPVGREGKRLTPDY